MIASQKFVYETFSRAVPGPANESVVEYAEKHVRLVNSAISEVFDRRTKPWLNEILECGRTPGRYSFVKPIQNGGGTTAGEILLCYMLGKWHSGNVSYFWPNDLKAESRFRGYTEKVLRACQPVMERVKPDRNAWSSKGTILFNNLNFNQLGARTDRNVSSDTLRGIVAEELHDIQGGWEIGRIDQMWGRQSAVWNAISFLISNASQTGDEFHQTVMSGSQEEWEVPCPGCKQFHAMRTRWKMEEAHLGGLRYDREASRRPDGSYDYVRLQSTLFFQMPCGYRLMPSPIERRALSLGGRYGAPKNKSALPNHRSFRLQAVACHESNWLELVIQRHKARRAWHGGDPRLMEIYMRERECEFWDPRKRPVEKAIVLSSERVKDRAGLANRKYRLSFFDYQEGRGDQGETPHFWGVIWDVDAAGNVLVVWEGRCGSEGELNDAVRRHEVRAFCVGVDASWTGKEKYIYQFCLRFGYNAIKVSGDRNGQVREFTHADGTRQVWSEPEPLWPHLPTQQGPVKSDPIEEPEFWNVSQAGAMNALASLRASKDRKFEIPSDVSPEFLEHFKAWNLEERRIPATNQTVKIWKKISERAPDHIFMCCCYLAVWVEQLGVVDMGLPTAEPQEESTEQPEQPQELSMDDRLAMM